MTKIIAELDPEDSTSILVHNVPEMFKDICVAIPGMKRESRRKVWWIKVGWANCLALRTTFKDRLEVGPNLSVWAAHEKQTRIDPCMALRQALDAPGLDSLYPFQRAGVQFLKTAGRALLCDDTGTGKTRQSIVALMEHYKDGTDPFPVLIICPNSTKLQWKREIDMVWPGLTVTIINGNITQRRKQLKTPSHIFIINWEAVRGHSKLKPFGSTAMVRCVECGGSLEKITESQCQVHEKELNVIDFKAVIADEVHRMKNGASQVTRAVKAAAGGAEIRIGMTATPLADTMVDLWSVLNFLSPDEWPVKSKFVERTIEDTFDMHGYKTYWGVRSHMEEEFFASFHPIMRRMTKKVVLPFLPPVIRETREIEMTPKQKKAYVQMRDKMVAELDEGSLLAVTSPMTVTQRLLGFASAYGDATSTEEDVFNDKTGEWETKVRTHVELKAPSNKIDAFMDDMDDFGKDQVVVFSASKQLLHLLSDKMTAKGIRHGIITGDISDMDERQLQVDAFQAGKLQWMLVSTAAGGTGLTLTAANTAVYLSRPWSMVESEQSEGRVLRIGSEIHDSVTYIDYVSIDTVDEAVIERLDQKLGRLEDILKDKELFRKFLNGEL